VSGEALALTVWLTAVAAVDVRRRRISNALVVAGLLPALLLPDGGWSGRIAAGLGVGAFAAAFWHRGVLGGGDVKALAVLGLWLGAGAVPAVLAASLALQVAFVGRRAIAAGRSGRRGGRRLPLGPALLTGWLVALALARAAAERDGQWTL